MNIAKRIEYYSRAGYPALYIPTHEDQRVTLEIVKGLKSITTPVDDGGEGGEIPARELFAWSCTRGLEGVSDDRNSAPDMLDIDDVLQLFIGKAKRGSVFVLTDVHLFFDDPPPMLIRLLKDALEHAKMCEKMLVIVGCRTVLPPEVEKLITIVDFKLPTRRELADIVLDPLAESLGIELGDDERHDLAAAGSGLTSYEFENALALSYIESKEEKGEKRFCTKVIYREKVQTVKKNGLVEYVEGKINPDHLGGLDLYKKWMSPRANLFTDEARNWGIKTPKGTLLVGVPGAGKSLAAKVCPAMLGDIPCLQLDMGKMFAGVVGASEQNMRSVLDLAEAVSPCVLWIDEIERGLSGGESSGKTDGGTTDRIIGTLLNWMQEKTKPVFVFATSNNVTKLPPQLLRKGRFDELWFVDLPNVVERQQIWKIVIERTGHDPEKMDLKLLAESTDGWTGSEIEELWNEALIDAFGTGELPHTLEVAKLSKNTVPLSTSAGEKIKQMRDWAKTYARPATSPVDKNKRDRMAARALN